jgi:hypothetical protein
MVWSLIAFVIFLTILRCVRLFIRVFLLTWLCIRVFMLAWLWERYIICVPLAFLLVYLIVGATLTSLIIIPSIIVSLSLLVTWLILLFKSLIFLFSRLIIQIVILARSTAWIVRLLSLTNAGRISPVPLPRLAIRLITKSRLFWLGTLALCSLPTTLMLCNFDTILVLKITDSESLSLDRALLFLLLFISVLILVWFPSRLGLLILDIFFLLAITISTRFIFVSLFRLVHIHIDLAVSHIETTAKQQWVALMGC